ncbi:hypothetical protein Tco_0134924 [Tanacetum coccineum]
MPTNRTLMSRGEVQQEEQRLNLDLHKEQGKRPPYASQDTSQKWNRTTTQSKPAGSRPEIWWYRRNEASRVEESREAGPKWEGPYRVTEAFEDGSYKLQTMKDKIVPRTWHAINLRKCYL